MGRQFNCRQNQAVIPALWRAKNKSELFASQSLERIWGGQGRGSLPMAYAVEGLWKPSK